MAALPAEDVQTCVHNMCSQHVFTRSDLDLSAKEQIPCICKCGQGMTLGALHEGWEGHLAREKEAESREVGHMFHLLPNGMAGH